MADNKKLTSKPDRSRVDRFDRSEMTWLRKRFPEHSTIQVINAVVKAGPMRKKIVAYLKKKKK